MQQTHSSSRHRHEQHTPNPGPQVSDLELLLLLQYSAALSQEGRYGLLHSCSQCCSSNIWPSRYSCFDASIATAITPPAL